MTSNMASVSCLVTGLLSHLLSAFLVSHHIMPSHTLSFYHVLSIISCRVVSCEVMSRRFAKPRRVRTAATQCHVVSHPVVSGPPTATERARLLPKLPALQLNHVDVHQKLHGSAPDAAPAETTSVRAKRCRNQASPPATRRAAVRHISIH